jgi:hypothetical protein
VLGHGYLHRQITRALFRDNLPEDEDEDRDEDEPGLEDDDDPATTTSSRMGNARSNVVVVVEHDVVFSRTYQCPMLCLRAWGEGGWNQLRCGADTQSHDLSSRRADPSFEL